MVAIILRGLVMKTIALQQTDGARLFGPQMLDDPYPAYQRLRETDPVYFDEMLKAWIVTRYQDVEHVFKDPRFSADRVAGARYRYAERYQPVFDVLSQVMVQSDGAKHKRLRNLVHVAFTRTAVDAYQSSIRALADTLLENATDRDEIDFMSDYAVPLPVLVISEIVGIPSKDRPRIKAWCDAYATVAVNFVNHVTDEQLQLCLESVTAFRSYLEERIAQIRCSPGSDLLSSLVIAEQDERVLSLAELIGNTILVLTAGNETTTATLGNGIKLLLDHPEQLDLVRSNPALVSGLVEETLRMETPVQFLGRIALEDAEIGGKAIRSGDMVLVVIGAANRDPDLFDNPDRFDVLRRRNQNLSFATGAHLCAGVQLARLEARIGFEAMLGRSERFDLLPRELKRNPNFNMRCWSSLPMSVSH